MLYKHTEKIIEVYLNTDERDKDIQEKENQGWKEIRSGYHSFDLKTNTEFISGKIYPYSEFEREIN